MKRAVAILMLILPFCVVAQEAPSHAVVVNMDSLTNSRYSDFNIESNWRFCEGDTATMSDLGYDDSKWEVVRSSMRFDPGGKGIAHHFSSIGWFRLHFVTDSSITGVPLSLRITEYGACEVYLDGKMIESYGIINGKDSSVYYDPQFTPIAFTLQKTGEHVLAIRYANFSARKNYERYQANLAGFKIYMAVANYSIKASEKEKISVTFISILLFGIFVAFSISHLFLFLYSRESVSNLYFSIFCISLALLFFVIFLDRTGNEASSAVRSSVTHIFIFSAMCLSLSGFINKLFGNQKFRFKVIAALCLLVPITFRIEPVYGRYLSVAMVGVVTLEAILLTVVAIYKKVKGARIIGGGILFLTLLTLTMLVLSFIDRRFVDVNDRTTSGQIVELITFFAVLSVPGSMSLYLAWNFANMNKDLKRHLQEVETLSERSLQQEQEKKRILENKKEELEKEVTVRTEEIVAQKEKIEKQHAELKVEKRKSDDLLLNILPEEIAEELKEKGRSDARLFNDVTVLFTDFVDFTKASEMMGPQELVNELDACFKAFDDIISKYGIEKIKTIGDAYLAVCGLPLPVENHAENVAKAAMEILQFMKERKEQLTDKTFEIRLGIHTGSVVAGIVGVKKFAYDIWGDTVNTAARMEQHSEAGKINISQTTYELLNDKFECMYRGEIQAKNKGALSMYFVEKVKN